MAGATIAEKYVTNPRATWDGTEKIPLDIAGADGVGLASALKTYILSTAAILGANTFTALQTITQASANAGILASSGYSLTGSNATSMVDLAGTWNTSGAPTGFKFNIVKTAADNASLLADFQVDGTSVFKIGNLNAGATNSIATFAGNIAVAVSVKASNYIWIASNNGALDFGVGADASIKRTGAAALTITDGATATGVLAFKFPAADPNIVGVWWDNAGTLTRSAG